MMLSVAAAAAPASAKMDAFASVIERLARDDSGSAPMSSGSAPSEGEGEDVNDDEAAASRVTARTSSTPDAVTCSSTTRTTRPRKKRKATYYARKEETAKLQVEAASLESRLRNLAQARNDNQKEKLQEALVLHGSLNACISGVSFAVASLESMLAQYQAMHLRNPLDTYIHLPPEGPLRLQILNDAVRGKLPLAIRYALERRKFANPKRASRQVVDSEADNGDFISVHSDVVIFRDVSSVKQVFDEMVYFQRHQEMSLTEALGMVMVRESEDYDGAEVSQCRMATRVSPRMSIESNLVILNEYFDHSELIDEPHGVMLVDYINEDALYPYRAAGHVRKDVSAIILLTACPSGSSSGDEVPKSMTITMTRTAFIRVHAPAFAMNVIEEHRVRSELGRYCDVMAHFMNERLAWQHTATNKSSEPPLNAQNR